MDVCSIKGICGDNGGICVPSANNSKGYECLCSENWRGENCEQINIPKLCPKVNIYM